MKKYLVEFIGTFFLTFTVATAAVYGTIQGAGSLAPLAIALVLMAMTYAGYHVSGAHFNPAVTLGVFLRGRCDIKDVAPYIISQLMAAFVGGAAASVVTGDMGAPEFNFNNTGGVLLAEFLFTLALVFVFINVTTASANADNSFYGLAIGGTVAVGTLCVGTISLGSFNPAVTVVFIMSGKLGWADCWLHLLPQILGGIAAAFAFKAVCPDEP